MDQIEQKHVEGRNELKLLVAEIGTGDISVGFLLIAVYVIISSASEQSGNFDPGQDRRQFCSYMATLRYGYSWRHQMVAVASAGYRAIAMDFRGYGLSDQPP